MITGKKIVIPIELFKAKSFQACPDLIAFDYLSRKLYQCFISQAEMVLDLGEMCAAYELDTEVGITALKSLLDDGILQSLELDEQGKGSFVISQHAAYLFEMSHQMDQVAVHGELEGEQLSEESGTSAIEKFKADFYTMGIVMMSEKAVIDALEFYATSSRYLPKIMQGKVKIVSMLRNQVGKIATFHNRDDLLAVTPVRYRLFEVRDGMLQPKVKVETDLDKSLQAVKEWQRMREHFENKFMDISGRNVRIMDGEGAFTKAYLDAIKSVSIDQWRAHSRMNLSLKNMLGRDCYVPADVRM